LKARPFLEDSVEILDSGDRRDDRSSGSGFSVMRLTAIRIREEAAKRNTA
jgi:hypothetical protein